MSDEQCNGRNARIKRIVMHTENYLSEDQLQADCYQWFWNTYPALRRTLFAVPNGGKRGMQQANVMKATGTTRGVADLVWLLPGGKVVFIEMKLPGRTQSAEQLDFEAKAKKLHHNYYIMQSFLQFKAYVAEHAGWAEAALAQP